MSRNLLFALSAPVLSLKHIGIRTPGKEVATTAALHIGVLMKEQNVKICMGEFFREPTIELRNDGEAHASAAAIPFQYGFALEMEELPSASDQITSRREENQVEVCVWMNLD